MSNPLGRVPSPGPPQVPSLARMARIRMDWKERIAKAKAEIESVEPQALDVEVGGEITALTFLPVLGTVWADLTATHPPRRGAVLDANVGYNTDAVAEDYPVERVTVDGETPDLAGWRDLLSVLSFPNRKNIASVLWGLNQMQPAKALEEAAGKASAGGKKPRSASPASSGSRRGASAGGSRRK